jgi:MFS family permease
MVAVNSSAHRPAPPDVPDEGAGQGTSPASGPAPGSAAGPAGGPALGPSLWSANFRLYFTARSVAMLGDTMLPVALSAGLLSYGYSAGDIGLVMAATTACFAGFVIFGGVVADRFNARTMMVGADLVRVCTQSAAAVLFLTHSVRLWEVVAIGVVNGTCAATFQPGVASTVVRVARDVQGANAVTRTAESAASLAGPALAGVLVGFTSAGAVFGVHAATYLTSALCLLALRLAPVREAAAGGGERASFRADLREGWREFRARTWMWSVILVWTLYTMCVMGPLTPLAAGQIIPEYGAGTYGLVNSVLGAGTAAGALLAMRVRADRPLRAGTYGIFAVALMPASVGLDLPVPWICACVFAAGLGGAVWGVNWATSVQTQVPNDILNRIHAYEVAGSVAMFPVGQALAGPAASAFGAQHVLTAGGVVAVGVAVALLSIPAVRGLRRAGGGAPVAEKAGGQRAARP